MEFGVIENGFSRGYRGREGSKRMIGPLKVTFSSIFTQLPTALFSKHTRSHSATEQERRAEPTGRKGDSASHRMRKGGRVGSKRLNQDTGGRRI